MSHVEKERSPMDTATPAAGPDLELPPEVIPNLDELVTEDGKPVDNILVERQYKLLTDPLYSSWSGPGEGRPWVAMANVGWFHANKQPPLVPDVLLSLDVEPRDPSTKEGRSYFQWILGKQPDLVVEIVSDKTGGEGTYKLDRYAQLGLTFYVIFDPDEHLGKGVLRAFELRRKRFAPTDPKWLDELSLGLTLWEGDYQGIHASWLRWADRDGAALPTGQESAAAKQRTIDGQKQSIDGQKRTIDGQKQSIINFNHDLEKMREKLRAAGIDPDA